MSGKKNHISELFDDAAYLLEEMDALEEMIEIIPYDEKPFGQESVMEMLAEISYADRHYFAPLIKDIVNGSYSIHDKPLQEVDKLDCSLAIDNTIPKEVFSRIRMSRKETMDLLSSAFRVLHSGNADSEPEKSGRVALGCLMRKMVDFDRLQLKKIAEKILSINFEKK